MIGSRWKRPDHKPELEKYNGYTVIAITNTKNKHPDHPSQVIYEGDNGYVWSLPLSQWPGNLIPEPIDHSFDEATVGDIARSMVDNYGFEITVENMELDMTNFSDALLNALENLCSIESAVYTKLKSMGIAEEGD